MGPRGYVLHLTSSFLHNELPEFDTVSRPKVPTTLQPTPTAEYGGDTCQQGRRATVEARQKRVEPNPRGTKLV